jgi:hypothetical protein
MFIMAFKINLEDNSGRMLKEEPTYISVAQT